MSLAQRRTATEGIDCGAGYRPDNDNVDDNESRNCLLDIQELSPDQDETWRTLSYDMFVGQGVTRYELSTPQIIPNMAAYEVSKIKRGSQIAFAVLACALSSGIVCGFAALKPVLIAEGVYRNLCPPVSSGYDDDTPCPEQDMRLNLFFISASIALNVSTILAGYVLDHHGRRVCYLLAALILFLGAALMGLAFSIVPEEFPLDCYIASNVLLGSGGTFLFISSYQLANAFPLHSGLIVAMITGAFDSSASVFLCYRLVYMGTNGTFKPEYFFFGFGVVILFMILGAEFALMPPRPYNSRGELDQQIGFAQDAGRDEHDSDCEIASPTELQRVRSRRAQDRKKQLSIIETVAGDAGKRRQRRERESERQDISGVWGVLHSEPISRQMATPWFLVILALTVLQMQRMNYFIATIRAQYRYMLDSEVLAERINDLFDVALPAAGVLSTPFIGILLNNVSAVNILGVLTAFIVLLGVLNCRANLCAGYATVIVFVFFRPLYYSAVSDYITKVFGFANFGRIYGAIICVSGFANLAQPLLDFLTHGPMSGDPTPVNIFFATAGSVISTALTCYTYAQIKSSKENRRCHFRDNGHEDENSTLLIDEGSVYRTA